jgi:hypothetical protein
MSEAMEKKIAARIEELLPLSVPKGAEIRVSMNTWAGLHHEAELIAPAGLLWEGGLTGYVFEDNASDKWTPGHFAAVVARDWRERGFETEPDTETVEA